MIYSVVSRGWRVEECVCLRRERKEALHQTGNIDMRCLGRRMGGREVTASMPLSEVHLCVQCYRSFNTKYPYRHPYCPLASVLPPGRACRRASILPLGRTCYLYQEAVGCSIPCRRDTRFFIVIQAARLVH